MELRITGAAEAGSSDAHPQADPGSEPDRDGCTPTPSQAPQQAAEAEARWRAQVRSGAI